MQTQSTRYMGIETLTLMAMKNIEKRHNLLAIWVLKRYTADFETLASRHNLLAIWVLKRLVSTNRNNFWETQSTRYMGIETTQVPSNIQPMSDTIYSLYGYWNWKTLPGNAVNSRHNLLAIWVLKLWEFLVYISKKQTQSTRYMGIETLLSASAVSTVWRHNLLAIWVLKLVYSAISP